MTGSFRSIFQIPELRKRVIFTLLILIVYRIASQIPLPGIDPYVLNELSKLGNNDPLLELISLFSGGGFTSFAILALGIMPYISATIVLQIMQAIFPALERLAKEGEYGRRKINLYTRYGTILLCIIQSIGLYFGLLKGYDQKAFTELNAHIIMDDTVWFFIGMIVIMTAGAMILLWMGELITENGIGNGVSLIIFGGIVASLPEVFLQTFQKIQLNSLNPVDLIIILLIFLGVTGLVVAEQQATRKIPVKYAKRVVANKVYQGKDSFLPFKLNPSGVIPVIFASALVLFPAQIISFLGLDGIQGEPTWWQNILLQIRALLDPGQILYMLVYMFLVVVFAYFYTSIIFNPVEIADNLKKQGGFIPGIRPGSFTSDFLSKVLNRITLPGSLFLGVVAIFPNIILNFFQNLPPGFAYLMGGTSILIMVGVGLDTLKQIESQMLMRNYSGFMKKGKLKGVR